MILVADVGTTFFKAGLMDESGVLVCYDKTTIKNHLSTVNDTSNWTDAFLEVLNKINVRKRKIDFVIISGNGPTLAPCNGGKAFLYSFEAEKESEKIKALTGVSFMPSMYLPKALYIKENYPDVWKTTQFFLSSPEYISYQLTGVAKTVMPLDGLERWYWNDTLLKEIGIEKEKLPAFGKTGEILGKVTKQASSIYGITEGTPVLVGSPDFVCSIVGSGAMHSGMICNRSGTSEGINYCSTEPVVNPVYMCYRHPNEKDWNISFVIPQSGLAIEEARVSTGFDKVSYDEMFSFIETHNDGKSKVIKDVCLKLCNNVKQAIDKVSDGMVSEIRLTGGPSKSDFLNRMRAEVTGYKVCTLETPEAGLSGLGIMAIASVTGEDLTHVADRLVRVSKIY